MTGECVRGQDVLDAAATGRWPDRVDADLRGHVSHCAICGDLAEIAPLLVADRDTAWEQADVPAASSVWWRAQMRVRREAAKRAERPMVLVQRAALAYAGVALFALGVVLGPWIRAWWRAARGFVQGLVPTADSAAEIASAMSTGLLPIVAVTLCLLLAPVLLYLALADH